MRNLLKYSVMLEGMENGVGFLITFDVLAQTEGQAIGLAKDSASDQGMEIIQVEDIEVHELGGCSSDSPCIIRQYGKGFFASPD